MLEAFCVGIKTYFKTITIDELLLADALLMYFCQRCVRLYGEEVSTPNMHLHAHIRECVEDYGPVQSFWLFFHLNDSMGCWESSHTIIKA